MLAMAEFRFASTMPGEVSVVSCLMMLKQVWCASSWEDSTEKVNPLVSEMAFHS